MANTQASIEQCRFRYLKGDAIKDPFSFIREFCSLEMEIESLKQNILNLVKTAYSYHEEFYTGPGKAYVYDQIEFIKVVEVMYVLHASDWDLCPGALRSYTNRYTCLTDGEQQDIRIFLDEFFSFHDLGGWLEILDDLLIHAYKEGGPHYFTEEREPFKTMAYLEKMAEAVFLVYEIISLKESYPQASGRQTVEDGPGCDHA